MAEKPWMTKTVGFSADTMNELGEQIEEKEFAIAEGFADCVVRVKQVALTATFGHDAFWYDALVVYEFQYNEG